MAKDTGFHYQRRDATQWEQRSERQSGFEGVIKDQYKTYRPRKGDNAVRILPPTWKDARHYGLDVWSHYNVGPDRASVICLQKMESKRCPCCEERVALDRAGDEQAAKDMRPRLGVVCWVLDMNNDRDSSPDPVVWVMPPTVDTEFCRIAQDKISGEIYAIDDPDEGYNVYFEREGERLRTRYGGYQIARRPSSVPQHALDYIKENPLPDALRWRNYDELVALLEGGAPAKGSDARRDDRTATHATHDTSDNDRRDRRRDDDDDRRDRRSNRDDDERVSRRGADEDRPSRRIADEEEERPSRRADEDDRRYGDGPASERDYDKDDERPVRTRSNGNGRVREAPEEEEDRPRGRDRDDDSRPRGRADDRASARGRLEEAERSAAPRTATLRQHLNDRSRGEA